MLLHDIQGFDNKNGYSIVIKSCETNCVNYRYKDYFSEGTVTFGFFRSITLTIEITYIK